MNIIHNAKYLAALAISGVFLTTCDITDQRPNILWIIAEDISPDLGCYGNTVVSTPNLDNLAREGTIFTKVYATGAVCSPSRSAMITGCYQTSIGAQNHRTLEESKTMLPDSIQLLSGYFNNADYYTLLMAPDNKKQAKEPGPWGSGKTDYNFKYDEKEFFKGNSFSDLPAGVPFFAQMTLKQTHRGEWWKLGEKRDPTVDKDNIEIPPFYPDHPVTRESFAAYYDAINTLDSQVGIILGQLDSLGLRENTVIVFTSDHGRPMPRGKQFCYEQGIHIPLIMAGRGIRKNHTDHRLLSSLDVSATFMGLAGIKPSGTMHGHDFLEDPGYEREYIVAARDRCDETVDRIRALRSENFKYIRNFFPERPYTAQNRYKDTRYPVLLLLRQLKAENALTPAMEPYMAATKPPEELFDLERDSFELNNLADDPDYKKVLEQHRAWLEEWLSTYPDYGAIPEPDSVMEKIMIQRVQEYGY